MTFALLWLAVASAEPSQSVTLKQLLESAETQNVDRRISIEQRNRAQAEFRQAWTSLLPALSVNAAWTHNQLEVAPVFGVNPTTGEPLKVVITPFDQFDGIFRLDLPLVDTGRWFRSAAAGSAASASVERERQARDQVTRAVIAAYYGYAAALALQSSAAKTAGVAQAQLELQKVRESAGAVTQLDLLRARAEVERTRQVVADTLALAAISRRTVQSLTGSDPGEAAALPVDDPKPEPDSATFEAKIDNLPGVKAAEQDAEAAERILRAQQLAVVPTINAQVTERLSNATSFSGRAWIYTAGIGLTWRLDVPVFQGMGVQSAASATAQLALERARLNAKDQIHADWQRLNSALIKAEAAKAQVVAATRAAQVAKDRYAVGAATQVDLIAAERDLFQAEVGQIQARTEAASARASLRISAGLSPLGPAQE